MSFSDYLGLAFFMAVTGFCYLAYRAVRALQTDGGRIAGRALWGAHY